MIKLNRSIISLRNMLQYQFFNININIKPPSGVMLKCKENLWTVSNGQLPTNQFQARSNAIAQSCIWGTYTSAQGTVKKNQVAPTTTATPIFEVWYAILSPNQTARCKGFKKMLADCRVQLKLMKATCCCYRLLCSGSRERTRRCLCFIFHKVVQYAPAASN